MNNLINTIVEYSQLSEDDKELFKTIINKNTIPVRNKDTNERDYEVFKEFIKKRDLIHPMVRSPKSPYFSPYISNPIVSYYSSKDI